MDKRTAIRTLAAVGLIGGAGGLLSACSEAKPSFKAVDMTGANYAKDFSLTDQFGQKRSIADFKGKLVVVFFGFAQCPEVCPTTLAELAQVKQALGADGDKLQGVFITVDPERDTAEVLKAYTANFDPSFLGLRGSAEELAAVAKDFKVYYKKVPGETPTSYTMDHSAGSYVYDTKGNLRLYVRYGSPAADLVADLQQLLKSA